MKCRQNYTGGKKLGKISNLAERRACAKIITGLTPVKIITFNPKIFMKRYL